MSRSDSLSAQIVSNVRLHSDLTPAESMLDLCAQSYAIASSWWNDHPEHIESVKAMFEAATGLDYLKNQRHIIEAYSDHYAEKAFLALETTERLRAGLEGKLPPELGDALERALSTGSVLLLTGHYGSVDLLPPLLAAAGFPVSVILRFKSETARQGLGGNAANLGMELYNASDGLPLAMKSLRRAPRVLVTACDAFRHWRRVGITEEWLGRPFRLDRTPSDFCRLLKASARLVLLERKAGPFSFACHDFDFAHLPPNDVPRAAFEQWRTEVLARPLQPYIWEELHELWTTDVVSFQTPA